MDDAGHQGNFFIQNDVRKDPAVGSIASAQMAMKFKCMKMFRQPQRIRRSVRLVGNGNVSIRS